jgi:hypothetical protein
LRIGNLRRAISGLAQREAFPDDEALRQYVTELAKATDDETGYEQQPSNIELWRNSSRR